MRRNIARIDITKSDRNGVRVVPDVVAVEEPLEIRIGYYSGGARIEKSISITMRTPGDDFELAAGFLFSESIIRNAGDIETIAYCLEKTSAPETVQQYNIVTVSLRPGMSVDIQRLERHFYTSSSCGVCGKASLEALQIAACPARQMGSVAMAAAAVLSLPEKLKKAQKVFEKTGGLHGAGLFDAEGNLVASNEDVGRHNALDKLIGSQLLRRSANFAEQVLAVSGRTSFEIMQKSFVAGIPIVVAVGAPSSLAVELATTFKMTLIGFVRADSFNIYSGAERIRM